MKPNISPHWSQAGVWVCMLPQTFVGTGYSPKEAYDDWFFVNWVDRASKKPSVPPSYVPTRVESLSQ
jgi:hypothetical protein